MDAGKVVVRLVADLKGFGPNLARAASQVKYFGMQARDAIGTAVRAFSTLGSMVRRVIPYAGLGLTGLAAIIIKTGAAAEEAENLFEVSFGNMSDDVRAWSEELAKSLKVSATGLRETAGHFQLFLTGMDINAESARGMSKALTEVAYDMASLRNVRFDDALTKIQAAMAGEVEPLRRLGITVNETTSKLWAQKQGLSDNVAAWSEQQKLIARMGVIFQGLQKDMGDLQRTGDSTTNLLRSIGDQFREVGIAVYNEWRPHIQKALTEFRDWLIENRETIAAWGKAIGDSLAGVLRFLANEWQTGWKQSAKAVEMIVMAMMDTVAILVEDTARMIGNRLPGWIVDGAKGAAKVGAKVLRDITLKTMQGAAGFGNKIREAISGDRNPDLDLFSGAVDEFFAEERGRGVNTGAKVTARWAKLADSLATLAPAAKSAAKDLETTGQAVEGVARSGWDAADSVESLAEKLPDLKAAFLAQESELGKTPNRWAKMWEQAAASIAGSMEDAVVKMTKDFRNAGEALQSMLDGIYEAITRAVFQTYMLQPIFQGVGAVLPGFPTTPPGAAPTVQQGAYQTAGAANLSGFARGGLVYARRGMWTPRGTDTVPAMLTPGEMVVPVGITDWLRQTLGGAGLAGPGAQPKAVTINVQAIDAAGTYQFLEKNKRAIASMVSDAGRGNHPVRRSGQ